MAEYYKYEEIKQHFATGSRIKIPGWRITKTIGTTTPLTWTTISSAHTRPSSGWEAAFEIIRTVKEYEEENFGEVGTDLSNPERVVNMYTYIVGEQVVSNWGWQ